VPALPALALNRLFIAHCRNDCNCEPAHQLVLTPEEHWERRHVFKKTVLGRDMLNQTEIWKQTLYKTLEDSEITQTIVIFKEDLSAFRLVQLYGLNKHRAGRKAGTFVSRHVTYSRDSTHETRERAMQEAQRLVAKYLSDHWLICRGEQTA
jgi:hypothetical protein